MAKQIFIIEDDGNFSGQLESLSNRLGCTVSAGHGDEIELEDVISLSPSLVIICQSGENEVGYNWCRAIKTADVEMPVVLIVDSNKFEGPRLEQHKHNTLCADGYLSVPLDGQTFIDTINDQLDLEQVQVEKRFLEIIVGGDQKKGKENVGEGFSDVFDGDGAGVTEDEAERALDALLDPQSEDEAIRADGPPHERPGTIALTDEDLYDELVLEELPLEDDLLVPISEGVAADPMALKEQIGELQRALAVAHQDAAQRGQDIVSLRSAEQDSQQELTSIRRKNSALTRELEGLKSAITSTEGTEQEQGVRAEVEHTRNLEKMQAEHLSEVLEIQREHARVLVSLEEELTAREKRVLSARDREHQVTLDALQSSHADALKNQKGAYETQLTEERVEQKAQLESLRETQSAQLAEIKSENSGTVEQLRSQHATEIESITGTHLSRVEEHLKAERDTSEAIKTNLEDRLTDLATKHEKAIESQKNKYEKKLEKLESKHQNTQEAQNKKREEQIEKLSNKHQKQLDSMTAKHEKQLEKLSNKYEKSLEKLTTSHGQTVESLESRISDAEQATKVSEEQRLAEKARLDAEIDALSSALKEAETAHSKVEKERAQIEAELVRLQDKHDAINKELKHALKDLKRQEMDLANEKKARADDLIELEAKHEDLKTSFQIDTERQKTLERALDTLNSELAAQEKSLAKEGALTRKAAKENKALKAELEEANTRFSEREENFVKLRTAIAVANVFAEELTETDPDDVDDDGGETS